MRRSTGSDTGLRTSICPRCGGPSEEGLCARCRVADTTWLTCDQRVSCVHCPTCESLKHGNAWSDMQSDHETLVRELILGAVHLHPELTDVAISVHPEDTGSNLTRNRADISGVLWGVGVEGSCEIEIAWKKEQCDRCSRISGGYYEGVVQVRAEGRGTDPYEREIAERIATDIESGLQEGGERLSFVSRIEEVHDGLDIVIGSHHLGRSIAQALTAELGGKITRHPSLIGERDGKALYRVTFLVRLPHYRKGDVVAVGDNYFEVRATEPHGLRVFDLRLGGVRSLNPAEVQRLVGNIREAEMALVVYSREGDVGILDPVTYHTITIAPPPWLRPEEGEQIRVLRDRVLDALIPVG